MTRTDLIAAVRKHALENYEQGWDVVVETYEDDEIATVIGRVRTTKSAIDRMAKSIELYNERRAEVQATADKDDFDMDKAVAFAEQLSTLPNMPLVDVEDLYRQQLEAAFVPETFVQDVAEAEAQAHRIAEALTVAVNSAQAHVATLPAWEPIVTPNGGLLALREAELAEQIATGHANVAKYLCGTWSWGVDLDMGVGLVRDEAFIVALLELEVRRRRANEEPTFEGDVDCAWFPPVTETGIVCGKCSHFNEESRTRITLRHKTVADVRCCYAMHHAMEEQQLNAIEAERLVERHFEEGF